MIHHLSAVLVFLGSLMMGLEYVIGPERIARANAAVQEFAKHRMNVSPRSFSDWFHFAWDNIVLRLPTILVLVVIFYIVVGEEPGLVVDAWLKAHIPNAILQNVVVIVLTVPFLVIGLPIVLAVYASLALIIASFPFIASQAVALAVRGPAYVLVHSPKAVGAIGFLFFALGSVLGFLV